MTSERTSKLDLVADRNDLVKKRRDFAICQKLDCDFDPVRRAWRGCNRIAAYGLIAVGRHKPQVDVLSGRPGAARESGRRDVAARV